MKKIIITAILLIAGISFGQQDPNYTFYRYNMNLVNPAYAGVEGTAIGLSIREQWAGVQGAPQTQGFFASHRFGKKVGMGVSIIHDKTFIESQTSLALDFSYQLEFGEEKNLYFGIKGAFNSYDANLAGLRTAGVAADNSLTSISGAFNPNVGVGVLWKAKQYYISFSAPKLLMNDRLQDDGGMISLNEEALPLYLSGGYDIKLSRSLVLKPSVMYRYVSSAPSSLDLTALLALKDKVEFGAAYRIDEGISGLFVFNASKALSLGYAYESAFESPVQDVGNGTHELFLKVRL